MKPKIKSVVIYDKSTMIGRDENWNLWVAKNWRKPKKTKWEPLGGDSVEFADTPAMDIITDGNNQAF